MPEEELPSARLDFKPWARRPLQLSGAWPRMTSAARTRAEACLKDGCNCGADTATFKRRIIARAVNVHLQCDKCGRSISGSLPRADHYYFQDYAEWNATLSDAYAAHDIEAIQRHHAMVSQHQKSMEEQAREKRQREYALFCKTSPEWRTLREATIDRAIGVCEACLAAPAVTAHHTTYAFGVLPPAWILRAVCARCHERLHADKLGRSDDWSFGR